MEVNKKIQKLRKENNLTQDQLAERLGVSKIYVARIENGKILPSVKDIKNIARILDVNVSDLTSFDDLIFIAENDNYNRLDRKTTLFFAILDILSISFIFMPFYVKNNSAMTLIELKPLSSLLYIAYLVLLIVSFIVGVLEIIFSANNKKNKLKNVKIISVVVYAFSILIFALSKQSYITAFLFLFLMIKILFLLNLEKSN